MSETPTFDWTRHLNESPSPPSSPSPRSPFPLTQVSICPDCERISCIAEEYDDEFLTTTDLDRCIEALRIRSPTGSLTFRKIRKFLYRDFLLNTDWAPYTRGVRVPLPQCVERNIRTRYPDSDEVYTGYHLRASHTANAVDRNGDIIDDIFWVRRGSIYVLTDSRGMEVTTAEGEARHVHYD